MRSALPFCVIVCVTITQTLGHPSRLGETRNEFDQHDEGERSAKMQMEYDVLPVPDRVFNGQLHNQPQEGRKGGYRPPIQQFPSQSQHFDQQSNYHQEPSDRYTDTHITNVQPVKTHYRTPYNNVAQNHYYSEETRITPVYVPAVDAEVYSGVKGGVKGGIKGGVKTRPQPETFDQSYAPESENMYKQPNVDTTDTKLKKLKEYFETIGFTNITDQDYQKIYETGLHPDGDYMEKVRYNTHTKQYEADINDEAYEQRLHDLKEYLSRKGINNLPDDVYKTCLLKGVCNYDNFSEVVRYNPRYRCFEHVFSEEEYAERLRALKMYLNENHIDYQCDDLCKRIIFTDVFQLQGWDEILVFVPAKRAYVNQLTDQELEKRQNALKEYLSGLGLENLDSTVLDKCVRTGDFEYQNYKERLRFNKFTGRYEIVLQDFEYHYRVKLLQDFLRDFFGIENLRESDLNRTIFTSQFTYGVYSDAVFYNQEDHAYELCVNNEKFMQRQSALQRYLDERGITILPSDKFRYAIKHGILEVKGRKQKIRYNPKTYKYEPIYTPEEFQQRLRELKKFLTPHNLQNAPNEVLKNAIDTGVFNYKGHNYRLYYDDRGNRYVFFVPDEDYQNRVKALNEFYKKRDFTPADHEYNLTIHLGTFEDGDYNVPLVYDQTKKQYKLDITPEDYQHRLEILSQYLEKRGYKNLPHNVLEDIINTGVFVNGDQKEKIDFNPKNNKFEIKLTPEEYKMRVGDLNKYFKQCGFENLPQSVYDQTIKNGVFEYGSFKEPLSYDADGTYSLKLSKDDRANRLMLLKQYLKNEGFKDIPEELYEQILDYGVFSLKDNRENVRFNVLTQQFEMYITESEYMKRTKALDEYIKMYGYDTIPENVYKQAILTGNLVLNDEKEKIRYNQKTKEYDLILNDEEFDKRFKSLKTFCGTRDIVKTDQELKPIVYIRVYEYNGIIQKIRYVSSTDEYKYNIAIGEYESCANAAKSYCRLQAISNANSCDVNKIVYYGLFVKDDEKIYLQYNPKTIAYQLHILNSQRNEREKFLKEYLRRRGFPEAPKQVIDNCINTGIYKHEEFVENLKYDKHLQAYEQAITPQEFEQRLRALQMYVHNRGYPNVPEDILKACVASGIFEYMNTREGIYYDRVTGVYIKLKPDPIPEPQTIPTVVPDIHNQKGDEPKTTSVKPGYYGHGVYYGNNQGNNPRQPNRNPSGHGSTSSTVHYGTEFNESSPPIEQVDEFGQTQMPTGSYIGQTQVTVPGEYHTSSSTTYGSSSTTYSGNNKPNRGSTTSYGSYSGRPRPTYPSNHAGARGDQKMDDAHQVPDYSQEDMGQQLVDFGQETEDLTQQLVNFGQEAEDLTQQVQNFGEDFTSQHQQQLPQRGSYQQQQPITFDQQPAPKYPRASATFQQPQQHEQIEQHPEEPEATVWTKIQEETKKLFG